MKSNSGMAEAASVEALLAELEIDDLDETQDPFAFDMPVECFPFFFEKKTFSSILSQKRKRESIHFLTFRKIASSNDFFNRRSSSKRRKH